ncbi:unnamed protein product [Sphagnum balticum]
MLGDTLASEFRHLYVREFAAQVYFGGIVNIVLYRQRAVSGRSDKSFFKRTVSQFAAENIVAGMLGDTLASEFRHPYVREFGAQVYFGGKVVLFACPWSVWSQIEFQRSSERGPAGKDVY